MVNRYFLEKTVVDLKSLDVHFKWKVWMCMFSIMFQHLNAHHVFLQPVFKFRPQIPYKVSLSVVRFTLFPSFVIDQFNLPN